MKWTRLIVYALLIVLAILFLVPLGVVIANSLRSNQEIAASSLIAWPAQLTFANYPTGLEQVLHGRALLGHRSPIWSTP